MLQKILRLPSTCFEILRLSGNPRSHKSTQINTVPTSVVTLDPRVIIPYTIQFGIGIQRQITANSSIAANYSGARGIDLFRSLDINPPSFGASPILLSAKRGKSSQTAT